MRNLFDREDREVALLLIFTATVIAVAIMLMLAVVAEGAPDSSEPAVYDFSDVHESLWVAVVLDCSGSMQNLPHVRARAQAAATLRSLQREHFFMLATFADSGARWRDEWTPSSAVDVALPWLETRMSSGTTNHEAGIEAALVAPPPVQDSCAVVLITDGPPDGIGDNAPACAQAAQGAPIFVLLVIAEGAPRLGEIRAWGRRVAEATGGDCREVSP